MIDKKKIEEAAIDCGDDFYEEQAIPVKLAFKDGINWFLNNLWNEMSSATPEKGDICLIYVDYEYEEYPEDNYSEYNVAVWHGDGWTEDNFPSDAFVIVNRWCRVKDLLKGGKV